MSDLRRVDVDGSLDPIQWAEVRSAPDLEGALWGLYYAIYYGGSEQVKSLPDSVVKAYARVQEAFSA